MTESPFRNVIVIGAGGGLGQAIVAALATLPDVALSVLARPTSKLPELPDAVRVLRGDFSAPDFLATAFDGQDMAVSCIGPAALAAQRALIDAAAAAGVRRFLPSEWAADTADPAVLAAIPWFAAKAEVVGHLRATAARVPAFGWTAVVNGLWWDECLVTGEMGFDLAGQRAVLYDGGERVLGGTTHAGVASAVRGLVQHPEVGRGEYVYVRALQATQKEVLAALERATEKKWTVSEATAAGRKQKGWERIEAQDFEGIVDVIWGVGYETNPAVDMIGPGRKISNNVLGVKAEKLDDVVATALTNAKTNPSSVGKLFQP